MDLSHSFLTQFWENIYDIFHSYKESICFTWDSWSVNMVHLLLL